MASPSPGVAALLTWAAGAALFAALVTALVGLLLLRLFPNFRSREQKSGEYRRDVVAAAKAGSSRLSAVVGPAMLLGLAAAIIPCAAYWPSAAPRLGYLLALCALEWLLGWLDDLRKARRGLGLGERSRLLAHGAIALLAGGGYIGLGFAGAAGFWGQLGAFVVVVIAFMYLVLSAGFSDGVDGLTASLTALSALAFGVLGVLAGRAALGLGAGATLGMALGALALNTPSDWTRTGTVPRRARAYLGDSGALLGGAAVALVAVTGGVIAVLPLLAAGFVVEGSSVFLQTGLLTPLFRRGLRLRRFRAAPTLVPHTEFPLPFLATPLHHHLNLVGLRPLQCQALFWRLQVVAAALGIGATLVPAAWPRAALWLAGLLALLLPLSALAALQPLFLSEERTASGEVALTICRGRPWQLWSLRLYRPVERLPGLRLPDGARGLLERPLKRYDALCLAAEAALAAGRPAEAQALLRRVPALNLLLRPEAALLAASLGEREGALDDLLHGWQAALRPHYQEGRLELVIDELRERALAAGQPALAAALAAAAPVATPTPATPAPVTQPAAPLSVVANVVP